MIDNIKRLFEYENWAIGKVIAIFNGVENSAALGVLPHVLAAKRIWLVRLNGQDSSSLRTHPAFSLSDCDLLARELETEYGRLLSSLSETVLGNTITYKNTKGEEFTTPIGEVLTHVVFHSAYHRGQIALLLRQGGDAAVNTDFISFTRP